MKIKPRAVVICSTLVFPLLLLVGETYSFQTFSTPSSLYRSHRHRHHKKNVGHHKKATTTGTALYVKWGPRWNPPPDRLVIYQAASLSTLYETSFFLTLLSHIALDTSLYSTLIVSTIKEMVMTTIMNIVTYTSVAAIEGQDFWLPLVKKGNFLFKDFSFF